MVPADDVAYMARMVKLLADRGRLAVVGLLAVHPRTLDELAEELPSSPRNTLDRNLKLLEDAEWISLDSQQTYSLRTEALTSLRAAMARVEVSPSLAPNTSSPQKTTAAPDEAKQAVIHAFFDEQGRLRRLPTQRRQREIILRHIVERLFTMGRTYDEQDIDDLLGPLYEDVKNLRRALVAEGILESRNDRYWLSIRM